MLVSEILSLVRRDINDLNATRWSDSVLLNYYNACRQILYARKPFVFYISSVILAYPGDVTVSSGTIDFDIIFASAVVDYIDYRCLYEDSEDANLQALAQDHLGKFTAAMS